MNKLDYLIVSGPSAVGKKTVIDCFRGLNHGLQLQTAVSHTTRDPRKGEVPGKDYKFTTAEDFSRMIHDQELVEWNKHDQGFYGVSFEALKTKPGKTMLVELEINGAEKLMEHLRKTHKSFYSIFILPPGQTTEQRIEHLRRSLICRGTETDASIAARLQIARKELDPAVWQNLYHDIVVNHHADEGDEKGMAAAMSLIEKLQHAEWLQVPTAV